MTALKSIFNTYGFKTEEQHLNLMHLLHLAGCLEPNRLKFDLDEIGYSDAQIQAALKIVEQATHNNEFNAQLILDKLFPSTYPVSEKGAWPEKVHNWLIKVTQREFFARAPGQERWQQATGQWMSASQEPIKEIIKHLKLEEELPPQEQEYQAIAVFGSTASEMKLRLDYAKNLVEQRNIQAKQLFLLCGERPFTLNVDGNDEFLNEIAGNYQIDPKQVTETHLMQNAYQQVKGENQFADIPVKVIDTPKGSKPRPTTVDTLIKLAQENPDLAGKVLFISRAPNIQAQAEDTKLILKEHLPAVLPEVVGASCENVALNRIFTALGGALFGGYMRVAQELGCQQSVKQLEQAREALKYNPIPKPALNLS
jgi:hypothetical protein